MKIRNIVSTLFLAEGHYDIKLLEEELLNLYEREADKQAVSLFLNWFKQLALYGKVSPDDYAKLDYVYRTKEEVRTMLVATLEQERKNIYQAGQAEGQQRTLLQFIHWRFQPTEEQEAAVAKQLVRVTDLQYLTKLTEIFLKVDTFDAFVTELNGFLPHEKETKEQ